MNIYESIEEEAKNKYADLSPIFASYLRSAFIAGSLFAIDKLESKWISVKDKMPEKNGRYLVLSESIISRIDTICYYEDGHFIVNGNVTHWIEIPAYPEVDG